MAIRPVRAQTQHPPASTHNQPTRPQAVAQPIDQVAQPAEEAVAEPHPTNQYWHMDHPAMAGPLASSDDLGSLESLAGADPQPTTQCPHKDRPLPPPDQARAVDTSA